MRCIFCGNEAVVHRGNGNTWPTEEDPPQRLLDLLKERGWTLQAISLCENHA